MAHANSYGVAQTISFDASCISAQFAVCGVTSATADWVTAGLRLRHRTIGSRRLCHPLCNILRAVPSFNQHQFSSIATMYVVSYLKGYRNALSDSTLSQRNFLFLLSLMVLQIHFLLQCRRCQRRCCNLYYLHRHQYAGTLPITVETYFLTFELLLPAGQQGGRSHHATNYESGAKCSADIRAVLAPPSGSAVAAGLRSCLAACARARLLPARAGPRRLSLHKKRGNLWSRYHILYEQTVITRAYLQNTCQQHFKNNLVFKDIIITFIWM